MGIINLGSHHILPQYVLVSLYHCSADHSWFSPLHLLIMEYVAPVSIFATICILILNTAQVHPPHLRWLTKLSLLITYSTTQQKDKTTLYTQVLSEYNTKFIEPRISVRKRDVGTSTPTTTSPENSPLSDAGTVEAATPSYGASGATLASFRKKYGPVEHTPLRPQSHSIGIQNQTPFTPRPMMKNSATSSFDLWNAGGSDFPSPQKRQAGPAKTMYHPFFPCVCRTCRLWHIGRELAYD